MDFQDTELSLVEGLVCQAAFYILFLIICILGYVLLGAGALKGEKRVLGFLDLELQVIVSLPMRFWELNSSPLQDQQPLFLLSHLFSIGTLVYILFYSILNFFETES